MVNCKLKPVLSLCVILFVCACQEDTNPINSDNIDDDIKNNISVEFTFLSNASFYKQSSILCKYNRDLYRFGTHLPVQVYNLDTKTWLELPIEDPSFARWDGAAVNFGDYIHIMGVAVSPYSNDIIKYSPISKTYEHSGIQLPNEFYYPAICTYNGHIIFLTTRSDSVMKYNTVDNKLTTITKNPFYRSDNYNRNSNTFSSGFYKNYFYVFFSNSTNNINYYTNYFYRLNVLTNNWEQLSIPNIIKEKELFGASLGDKMILFHDNLSTYAYFFDEMEWAIDNSIVPIPNISQGEWSFSSNDSCLYGSEVWSKSLWKITIKNKVP